MSEQMEARCPHREFQPNEDGVLVCNRCGLAPNGQRPIGPSREVAPPHRRRGRAEQGVQGDGPKP